MELFYRKYGAGPPIIIVHGLYGMSDNWVTIAKVLSKNFEVFLVDQRNHGRSPHSIDFNYELLKTDLLEFMDEMKIKKAILIGHSMGGKTVMFFAKDYPERVSHLIVIDIAPKSYIIKSDKKPQTINHFDIIDVMKSIDFGVVASRQDVEDELSKEVKFERVRRFILKNLYRNSEGKFNWWLNISSLEQNLDNILAGLNKKDFEKGNEIVGFPVLFIKGANSDYILDEDYDNIIVKIFPYAELVVIPNAGHWVHAEQTILLIETLIDFME